MGNINDKKAMLRKALKPFKFHERAIDEIISIIIRSGCEQKFLTALLRNLKLLEVCSVDKLCRLEPFENLKEAPGIYSMRFKQQMNCRLLFSVDDSGQYYLLFFYERQGKSKTDYSSYIKPAQQRLKELKEEL